MIVFKIVVLGDGGVGKVTLIVKMYRCIRPFIHASIDSLDYTGRADMQHKHFMK
jgi:signal recognition particle receptor subunit beta